MVFLIFKRSNLYYCAAGATLRTAQPRRSAEGARLDGFLAESKGLFGNLGLRHFANNYQVSSAKSGSGQPPDRAQICSFVVADGI